LVRPDGAGQILIRQSHRDFIAPHAPTRPAGGRGV
jgi:hypothetical protein